MKLALGIDSGGTYTDAVIIDFDSGAVLDSAKSLTTRYDLSVGIINSINKLHKVDLTKVKFVSISTTLATNSIVEGKGGRVCLILIGYDPELIRAFNLDSKIPIKDYHIIAGKHNLNGEEVVPLDMEQARKLIAENKDRVEAFAVSSFLSVMNPEHEIAVKGLIESLTDLPVVCGHDLTSELNSIKRAATVALNARLIPVIEELILSVEQALVEKKIEAPLAVVKGDGSLMSAEMARERPIETILSGPAASSIGAWFLSGRNDGMVVDMGGTTTDIAVLKGGKPRVNPKGATVGEWITAVRAADMRTCGIGGDSYIRIDREGVLRIGPRRVIPLCLASVDYPQIIEELEIVEREGKNDSLVPYSDFFILMRKPDRFDLNDRERSIVKVLQDGPKSLHNISKELGIIHPYLMGAERLEELGIVSRIAPTPTDVLHAEGSYLEWNSEASQIAVRLLARRLRIRVEDFIIRVKEETTSKIALEVLTKLTQDEIGDKDIPGCDVCSLFLNKSLNGRAQDDTILQCDLIVKQPIIAIGAPVAAYFPYVVTKLKTNLVIPPYAEVANAVGAVTGSVVIDTHLEIDPIYNVAGITGYVLHSPEEKKDFDSLEEAIDYGMKVGLQIARREAKKSGAEDIEIRTERIDEGGDVGGNVSSSLYLGTILKFTAIGRPRMAN